MEKLQRVTGPTREVLSALLEAEGPVWGLLLIKTTGRLPGTVYPLLERLVRLGWVTSSWEDDADRPGPRRRLYEFTADGRAAAVELAASAPREATSASRPRRSSGRAALS